VNVIDLLVTIVVVTILVTIVLAVVTYVAYKLRLAREPTTSDGSGDGLRYFVRYEPPRSAPASPVMTGSPSTADSSAAESDASAA
jgi:hypothetical protein